MQIQLPLKSRQHFAVALNLYAAPLNPLTLSGRPTSVLHFINEMLIMIMHGMWLAGRQAGSQAA